MDFERARELYDGTRGFFRRYVRPVLIASSVSGAISWLLDGPALITGILLGTGLVVLVSLAGGWIAARNGVLLPPAGEKPEKLRRQIEKPEKLRRQIEKQLGIRQATEAQLVGQPVTFTGKVLEVRDNLWVVVQTPSGEEVT